MVPLEFLLLWHGIISVTGRILLNPRLLSLAPMMSTLPSFATRLVMVRIRTMRGVFMRIVWIRLFCSWRLIVRVMIVPLRSCRISTPTIPLVRRLISCCVESVSVWRWRLHVHHLRSGLLVLRHLALMALWRRTLRMIWYVPLLRLALLLLPNVSLLVRLMMA